MYLDCSWGIAVVYSRLWKAARCVVTQSQTTASDLTVGLKAVRWGWSIVFLSSAFSHCDTFISGDTAESMNAKPTSILFKYQRCPENDFIAASATDLDVSCSSPVHAVAADHSMEQMMHTCMSTRPLGRPLSQMCWTGPEKKVCMQSVETGNERYISSDCIWFCWNMLWK